MVDYAELKKQRATLDAYLRSLEAVDPAEFTSWERADRYAFWINAYNSYTVQIVVDHFPIESIKKIGEPEGSVWDRRFIDLKPLYPQAEGDKLSLNDIEHRILRPQFKDARVHAAVNCASIGCPQLRNEAFRGETLERQLDAAARAWLNDVRLNRFDGARRVARISRIFEWFEEDFVRDSKSVALWLARFAPKTEHSWLSSGNLRIEYLEYDWRLNVVPKKESEESEKESGD